MKDKCHQDVFDRYDETLNRYRSSFDALKEKSLRTMRLFDKSNQLMLKEDEQNPFLLRDLVKFLFMRLEMIHDSVRDGYRVTNGLRQSKICSHIEGYDIADLCSISNSVELRSVNLKVTSGQWPTMIGQSIFIPLLAANLGDIIQPKAVLGSCGRTQLVPCGSDFMATTLSCLKACDRR